MDDGTKRRSRQSCPSNKGQAPKNLDSITHPPANVSHVPPALAKKSFHPCVHLSPSGTHRFVMDNTRHPPFPHNKSSTNWSPQHRLAAACRLSAEQLHAPRHGQALLSSQHCLSAQESPRPRDGLLGDLARPGLADDMVIVTSLVAIAAATGGWQFCEFSFLILMM